MFAEDPVRMFEHKPKPPNSLLKFLSDLYSSQQTSGLLYTNDARVLIDIVLRQITDLSAHDQVCHSHSVSSLCCQKVSVWL